MCKISQEVSSQERKRTNGNMDLLRILIHSYRRLGVEVFSEEMNINKEMRPILTEDLAMRKLSTKIAP